MSTKLQTKVIQTRFNNAMSGNVIVVYEKKYVLIGKLNDKYELEYKIYMDNNQIKKINDTIVKNNS